jgi:DNA topoisomerase-3
VDAAPSREELGAACPQCAQGRLITGRRGWGCSRWREGCTFVLWFELGGKRLTPTQARELAVRGRTRPASGFRDAHGQTFRARLVLERDEGTGTLQPSVRPEEAPPGGVR